MGGLHDSGLELSEGVEGEGRPARAARRTKPTRCLPLWSLVGSPVPLGFLHLSTRSRLLSLVVG